MLCRTDNHIIQPLPCFFSAIESNYFSLFDAAATAQQSSDLELDDRPFKPYGKVIIDSIDVQFGSLYQEMKNKWRIYARIRSYPFIFKTKHYLVNQRIKFDNQKFILYGPPLSRQASGERIAPSLWPHLPLR